MTVAIDPSEIRRQGAVKATVKALDGVVDERRLRLPARTLLLGSLGGASLLAFTIGAFSFFGGLADPRVRTPRPMPVAAKMPDLKDGLPALVADGASAAPAAAVLNLPKPPAVEPVAASAPGPAKAEMALRGNDTPAAVEPAASAPPATSLAASRAASPAASPPVADATGSVAQRKPAPVSAPLVASIATASRAKATPTIENAATVPGDVRSVPLIAPARTAGPLAPAKSETVRAKPVAVAALPSEAEPSVPAVAAKHAAQDSPETKSAPAKKSAQKSARAKAKPAAEASAEPEAASAAPESEDEGFGTKINRGIKAIGGMFGQE